ncbi:hypothetical protein [Treponema primitia]|uniref:hypothetical protein n=1 Tax=Treponema primitia TaxID=88058 RepID=UPI0002554D27|nr:hypothetical protein [Treponema primitia]
MQDITDKEGETLYEYHAEPLPATDLSKSSVTTQQGFRMVVTDRLSKDYILTWAIAAHKTPTEIIGELVWEKFAVAV